MAGSAGRHRSRQGGKYCAGVFQCRYAESVYLSACMRYCAGALLILGWHAVMCWGITVIRCGVVLSPLYPCVCLCGGGGGAGGGRNEGQLTRRAGNTRPPSEPHAASGVAVRLQP